jgi:predicted nucleic acid-binding protein
MTDILVDSNVILDIVTEDPNWFEWSSAQLVQAADQGNLIINPIIYAEISIGFTQIEDLGTALPSDFFQRQALPWDAAFLAGKAFLQYRQR